MKKLKTQIKRFKTAIVIMSVIILGMAFLILRQDESETALPDIAIEVSRIRDVELTVSANGFIEGVDDRDVFIPSQTKITDINVSVGTPVTTDSWLAKYETFDSFGRAIEESIFSPIRGTVTEINYGINDIAGGVGNPAFVIVDNRNYIVELQINENDIRTVDVGETASLVFPAISLDQEFEGKVSFVAPTPLNNTGSVSYLVEIEPKELPQDFKLGMSVDVEILADKVEDVVAIPESFLIERDGKYYVKELIWLDDQRQEYEINERDVELGLITDEYVEIIDGIEEGYQLVEPSFTVQNSGFGFF